VSLKLSCRPFLPYLTSHPLSLSVILTTSPLAVRAQRNILLTPHYDTILFKPNVVGVETIEFLYFSTLEAVSVGNSRKAYSRYWRVLSFNIASTCLGLARIKIGYLRGKIYSILFWWLENRQENRIISNFRIYIGSIPKKTCNTGSIIALMNS
jgi:hypothetical protein